MGGNHDKALRRAARLADGFIPLTDPAEVLPRMRAYLAEAGRDADAFGFMGRLVLGGGGPTAWLEAARKLQALGATHLSLSTPPDVPAAAALQRLIEARGALGDEFATAG